MSIKRRAICSIVPRTHTDRDAREDWVALGRENRLWSAADSQARPTPLVIRTSVQGRRGCHWLSIAQPADAGERKRTGIDVCGRPQTVLKTAGLAPVVIRKCSP